MDKINLLRWFCENQSDLVEQMKKTDHNISMHNLNPHHAEGDVWTHTMMVYNQISNKEHDYKDLLNALLHDIGKPLCRKEKEGKVYFKGHDGLSAFLSLDVLEKLKKENFLSDDDILLVFYVIANHINIQKVAKKAQADNTLWPFVEYCKNDSKKAAYLLKLALADQMGRISKDKHHIFNEDFSKRIDDEMIFLQMDEQYQVIDEKKPIIEILIGLPGSGKSTYASKHPNIQTIICRDSIMLEQGSGNYKECYDSLESSAINTIMIERIKKTIINQDSFIVDNISLSKDIRGITLKRVPHYHKKAVVFVSSFKTLVQNNIKRKSIDKNIDYKILIEMSKKFEFPDFEEFDEIELKYY